jgi:hypothetical protein
MLAYAELQEAHVGAALERPVLHSPAAVAGAVALA